MALWFEATLNKSTPKKAHGELNDSIFINAYSFMVSALALLSKGDDFAKIKMIYPITVLIT